MSKSVFIGALDTFDVVVNYKEDGRRLKILAEPEKDEKGAVTSQSITVTFRYPNFADSQQILRAATQIDVNGNPSLNFLSLQTSLLYSLLKSWDVKDESGAVVDVSPANISKLRIEIAKELIAKVYLELGDGGLI